MAGTGGARKGAGRRKGGKNQRTRDIESTLDANRNLIVDKAIAMATHRTKPNTTILAKLLDKVLPTLNNNSLDAKLTVNDLPEVSDKDVQEMIVLYGKVVKSKKRKKK